MEQVAIVHGIIFKEFLLTSHKIGFKMFMFDYNSVVVTFKTLLIVSDSIV